MGAVHLSPHPWVGKVADSGNQSALCEVEECGLEMGSLVHKGFKLVFAAIPPKTETVAGTQEQSGVTDNGVSWKREGKKVHFSLTAPAVQAWDAYSAQVRDLLSAKSVGYGNAWQEQGYMGNLARVLSKTARIKNMMWGDHNPEDLDHIEHDDESVLDTLKDLGALCALAIKNIEEGNRWGR